MNPLILGFPDRPPRIQHNGPRTAVLPLASLIFILMCSPLLADTTQVDPVDLSALSLEELMNIEITSVSKKAEPISSAAAAVFVLTADDIQRSGFNSIPELLRLVPGLQVAKIDLSDWAISARGYAGQFASKLLVMVDGRSVYSPCFSGVFWDQLSMPLEDIARIEVIRGPGATMWGANAVNGVINIITKDARQTQGGVVNAAAGNNEKISGSARYGGKLSDRTFYRAYLSGFDRSQDGEATLTGRNDYWNDLRIGLRLDHDFSPRTQLLLEGNWYDLNTRHEVNAPELTAPYYSYPEMDAYYRGGYSIARLKRQLSPTSDATLQTYFDVTDGKTLFYTEERSTIDVEFKHSLQPLPRNTFVWGLGYRNSQDYLPGLTDPERFTLELFNAFGQNEWNVIPGRLRLIAGSKFEHNTYTKWEIQPSVRTVWSPHTNHTIWASAARPARNPSRAGNGPSPRVARSATLRTGRCFQRGGGADAAGRVEPVHAGHPADPALRAGHLPVGVHQGSQHSARGSALRRPRTPRVVRRGVARRRIALERPQRHSRGVPGFGRLPMRIGISTVSLSRTKRNFAVEPGLSWAITLSIVTVFGTAWPSTSTRMSPTFTPARSAGPLRITPAMIAPSLRGSLNASASSGVRS